MVKPAFPSRGMEPVFGAKSRASGKGKVCRATAGVVLMSMWRRSRSLCPMRPVWDNGRLYSRSVVLRAYVLNTGNGWMAIPGDWCASPKPKARSCRCSAADTARTHGFCGTAPWILSVMLHPRNQPVALRRGSPGRSEQRCRQGFLVGTICRTRGKHGADRAGNDLSRAARRPGENLGAWSGCTAA